MDTIGEYQHRRTAMQEVRFAIEDATGGRDFEHRLMDFNKLSDRIALDNRPWLKSDYGRSLLLRPPFFRQLE